MGKSLSLLLSSVMLVAVSSTSAFAKETKPNILVIWGDDIGYSNISVNNQGMISYKTPNIDRIAHEGAVFTDWSRSNPVPPVELHLFSVNILFEPDC